MNKKFKGALLFGALLMASTSVFVSCKDYDDDVKDLQTQINNLTQAVNTKETTINTSIVTLRNAVTALEALEDAYKRGDVATLEAAKRALADAEAALQAAYQSGDAATLAAAKQAVEDAKTNLKAEMAAADEATLAAAKQAVVDAQTALQAAINANYETLVAKDAELNAAIVRAQTAVDQAMTLLGDKADKTELAAVNNELQNTIQNLNTLSSSVTGALANIQSLQTALAAQEAALTQTNANMASAMEQINTLKQSLAEQEAALRQAIAEETARVNAELSSLGTSLEELRVAHETFALKTEVATVQSKVNGIDARVQAMASDIAAVDAKLDVISAMLAKALRSLVYMPELYMDGIETIEYPYLRDTTLAVTSVYQYRRVNDNKLIKLLTDYKWPITFTRGNSNENNDNVFLFGPAWDVYYHMNPSKANPKYADVQGYYAYQVETITRAAKSNNAASLKITSPEKYADGSQLYKVQNGIMTAGLQVNLKYPNAFEGNADKVFMNEKDGNKNIIVGLQVKSVLDQATTSSDTIITSDYAMLYPEKVWLEGIVWTKEGSKANEFTVNVGSPVSKDEACTINGNMVHVWDSPEEALEHNGDDADVKLYWDGQSGLDLADYLGVHYVRESLTSKAVRPGLWNFNSDEMLRYGLKVKFDSIDYQVDTNETRDSRFVKISDGNKKGNIKAQNVDAQGNPISGDRVATVGREPLIRVRVYLDQPNWGVNKPILDGYILVKIVRNNPATPENIIVVDKYPVKEEKFDFCEGKTIWNTNWSQFHSYVLDQTLNLDKDRFDAQYEPDLKAGATPTEFNLYKKSGNTYVASTYGKAIYVENTADMTNHRYYLDITAKEFENLTHDKTLPFEDELYIRYSKKAGSAAEYDYVYVKIPVKLGRNAIEEGAISGKNTNYWYRIDGNDEGLDGIALNVFEPFDGEFANVFSRPITHTFTTNKVTLGAGNQYKFFFLPVEYTIKALNGKVYKVTPRKSATDETWNAMVCLYDLHTGAAKYTTHKFMTKSVTENGKTFFKADDEANKQTLQNCVINWNDGVYNNTSLYAVYNGNYTEIAKLTNVSADGTIELQRKEETYDVLNAIGFDENKGNFNDQLRSFVCVVSFDNTKCDYAYHTKDASFVASWERPINVDEHYTKPFIDAETNGNYLYAVDFLHLYDWRGWPIDAQGNQVHYGDRGTTSIINYRGDMENEHKWYWAYYGINKIYIDCRPTSVMTNMHQTNKNNFVKLSDVTTRAKLYAVDAAGNKILDATCSFNLDSYNKVSQNAALLAHMESNKQLFGGIFYCNNGDNVEDFKVRIPVTISYLWGNIPTTVEIEIKRSIGQ